MMDTYEKKYKGALARCKWLLSNGMISKIAATDMFRELMDNDENIRKEIINIFHSLAEGKIPVDINYADIFTWLEKQGKQKDSVVDFKAKDWYVSKADGKIRNIYHSVDKVEPKFKVGDWIAMYGTPFKILSIERELNGILDYILLEPSGNETAYNKKYVDENSHLWTIQDAKQGDVLYHKAENGIEYIVMNKGVNENNNVDSYFRYHSIDGFNTDIPSVLSAKCDSITPATKEQRDLLFQKMKEAGYEWDAEKKELRKIEPTETAKWSAQEEDSFEEDDD